MTELAGADEFIFSHLAASSALAALVGVRVYNAEKVPQSATLPYVSFQFISGTDYRTMGGRRVMTNTIYLVKAVLDINAGNPHALGQQINEAFDLVLDGIIGVQLNPSMFIQGCERIAPVRYREDTDGKAYLHYGARYRCLMDGSD